jgi:hypothetical protein
MILVSFCNTKNSSPIYQFGDDLNSVEGIRAFGHRLGSTGLTNSKFGPLAVLGGTEILSLSTGEVFKTGLQDIHSIRVFEDKLFATFTPEDSIVFFDLSRLKRGSLGDPQTLFKGRDDLRHINSIEVDRSGNIFYTQFGYGWRNTDGFGAVKNSDCEVFSNIRHPHSLKLFNDSFYYLESKTGTCFKDGREMFVVEGYARGLEILSEDEFLVGLSKSRNEEKPGVPYSILLRVNSSGGILDKVEIPDENEIYDILKI